MHIERLGTTRRWSDAVIHNHTVYCVEVASNPDSDIHQQTTEVLSQLEATLLRAGSNKSRILSIQIFLSDITFLDAFNQQWDEWVQEGYAPSRACVQAKMANPGYKVELVVTAARL